LNFSCSNSGTSACCSPGLFRLEIDRMFQTMLRPSGRRLPSASTLTGGHIGNSLGRFFASILCASLFLLVRSKDAGVDDLVGTDSGVSVLWGLSDAVATVGTFFHYQIPSDAFRGPVSEYKVILFHIPIIKH